MSEIEVRKTHSKSLADAQQVADDLAADLAEKFGIDYGWDGDVIHFSRTGCSGEIAVDGDCVHVRAKLGFLLGYLKPTVEREIVRYLDEHFD
ncbi:MAG: polyhydroxyalkanoic acid system family protein [Wenzhouxiangellaceae bacterium]|nr:polyhydroxyalkanoic acid system family protein [Wenzhouxiangellaceae bacterium]